MSGNHIPFHKMSDLYDNEIGLRDERELIMRHLSECETCALEYRRLEETLRLCGRLAATMHAPGGLPAATMKKIISGNNKKRFMRSVPAIAASILIVSGAALFNAGIIGVHDRGDAAGVLSRSSVSDSERVIDIIRKHKASIVLVTDEYVEGMVPVSSFNELRRGLGLRRVAYMPASEGESDRDIHWGNAIEEVGVGDGQAQMELAPQAAPSGAPVKYIRFRVLR
ncbi:MAG: hypothetical protein JXA07_05520 [Spirochaetes bacterium]|nr:hypothetical protein [Spirochaetota bacterium]